MRLATQQVRTERMPLRLFTELDVNHKSDKNEKLTRISTLSIEWWIWSVNIVGEHRRWICSRNMVGEYLQWMCLPVTVFASECAFIRHMWRCTKESSRTKWKRSNSKTEKSSRSNGMKRWRFRKEQLKGAMQKKQWKGAMKISNRKEQRNEVTKRCNEMKATEKSNGTKYYKAFRLHSSRLAFQLDAYRKVLLIRRTANLIRTLIALVYTPWFSCWWKVVRIVIALDGIVFDNSTCWQWLLSTMDAVGSGCQQLLLSAVYTVHNFQAVHLLHWKLGISESLKRVNSMSSIWLTS